MRSRILPVAGASAVALAAAVTLAPVAGASGHHAALVHQGTVHNTIAAKGKACFSVNANDTGVGILSQNFGDEPTYDSSSAADFTVKKSCTIAKVSVVGQYFNGSGPAQSETVVFYMAKKGEPGKIVNSQTIKGKDNAGSFDIKLKKAVKLKKGTYFVSVQANMDFSAGGEWGWNLSSDQAGAIDQFQNQGGAFGVCPTWDDVTTCVGYGDNFLVTLS